MSKEIIFEEISKDEKILLLRAFDYNIDEKGYIINSADMKIPSNEIPNQFMHINNIAMVPGSMDIIDGTPVSISKFIREKVENHGSSD
ncbi:MAG: hypothetical protein KAI55_02995 [Candidatus Aenigmarchaeota archaeon]|nr:hypothetical protein [Candidatus Aenigmarchaeota archaeon]